MDYLVLARKWRPQRFEDVVGQEPVVRTLQNAIRQERMAHALIFSGPRGVGKTSIARILAKSLNCEQGPTETPCNACRNCLEITAGTAMDVREIDGASNRGIDEIRELRENVKFAPLSSRSKIYIIDEVHMLTREAFNALLKTLEEPPRHVTFIFATTENHKIPATILSRCQYHEFRRVSPKEIAQSLTKIAASEGIAVSETALRWIAQAGDGSVRDALSIFDQVIAYGGLEIQDGDVEEVLGLTDRRFLQQIGASVLARDAGRCLKAVDEAYFAGLDMKHAYQKLLAYFRNLLLVKIIGPEGLSDASRDEASLLQEQAGGISRETLQRLLDILLAEEENVRRSPDPRLNLETALVRMAYLEPVVPLDEVLQRMEGLARTLGSPRTDDKGVGTPAAGGPPREPQVQVKETGKSYGADPGRSPDKLWEDYKVFVKEQSPVLGSKLAMGRLMQLEGGSLQIGFSRGYVLDEVKEQKATLDDLLRSFSRGNLTITLHILESDGETGAEAQGAIHQKLAQDARKKALDHPVLQKVLDVFGSAEVLEVTPKS